MSEELRLDVKNRKRVKECPCGKTNKDLKFVPYVGYEDKGHCFSCFNEDIKRVEGKKVGEAPIKRQEQKYIPLEKVFDSQERIQNDTFYRAFSDLGQDFDDHMKLLNVGTDNKDTLYWSMDQHGRAVSVKVIEYQENGKRNKKRTRGSTTYNIEAGYYPGLFNSCALIDKDKTVVLVEAEKTAVLGSYFFDDYIWIASGGTSSLSYDKALDLKDRDVIVIVDPDDGGREHIKSTIETLKKVNANAVAYDMFPERVDGYDIADFIDDRRSDPAVIDSFIGGKLAEQNDLLIHDGVSSSQLLRVLDKEKFKRVWIEGLIERGETTHFYEFDKHLKWMRGFVYSFVGYTGMGKSEITKFFMLLKALKDGWKIALFVPEDEVPFRDPDTGLIEPSPSAVFLNFIHTISGKTTDRNDINHVDDDTFDEITDWIFEHFYFINAGDYPSQNDITNVLDRLIDDGHKFDAVIIDPFNNLKTAMEKNELIDEYQTKMCKQAKSFAVKHDLVWIYAMHPPKMTKDKDGRMPTPDLGDSRGGMGFSNSSDFFVAINRPWYFCEDEVEYNDNRYDIGKQVPLLEVNVRKVKHQNLLGIYQGFVEIDFDKMTNRYKNQEGVSPVEDRYRKNMTAQEIFSPGDIQRFPQVKEDDIIELFDSPPQKEEEEDDLEDENLPF